MWNFLNEEEISKSIKKLELEINDEKLNFDDINTLLSALNVSYKTNNKTKLDELLFNLNTKLTTISSIHDDNVEVLRKNLDTYITTREKVANMFDDIVQEDFIWMKN